HSDAGFVVAPWLYSNVIEAQGERGSQSTLISVGNDGNYGADDEIHFITDGSDRMTVDASGLHVMGNVKIEDGNEAAGFIPVSDANGLMTWTDPASISTASIFELHGDTVRLDTSVVDITAANFVFGSPQLDDDENTNHDNRMFFDKSKGAFRVGRATGTQWDTGNLGTNSVAFGRDTKATGIASTAMGSYTEPTGNYSTAMGYLTKATGTYSTAMGYDTEATGAHSTAMGTSTEATGDYSTAMGLSTKATGLS
ncbi:MAG: hypothetical protein GY809_02135, partial [Planctomycetes bacterium]|nr:hypothetical protein [Planctomycetota bacterium]